MLCIKIPNVIYKFPIFAPPARPKAPMLYIKIKKLYINFKKVKIFRACGAKPQCYI